MKEERKHIDNVFYDELDGFNEPPPAGIWSAVESALDEHALISAQQRRHRMIFAVAASLIIIAATSIVYWIAQDRDGIMNTQDQAGTTDVGSFENRPQVLTRSEAEKSESPERLKNHGVSAGQPVANREEAEVPGTPGIERNDEAGSSLQDKNLVVNTGVQNEQQYAGFQTGQLESIERSPAVAAEAPSYLPVAQSVVMRSETGNGSAKTVINTKSLKKHRYSIIAFFAPDITTRNLEQDVANGPDENKEVIAQAERNGMLDYTLGARVEYRINNHLSIQSGVSLSRNTIDIASKTVYARFDKTGALHYRFNMSTGYAFFKLKKLPLPQSLGDSAKTSGSTSTLHYINIPLVVKYSFDISRRLSLSLQAGITTRFIAWDKIAATYDYNGEKEKSINDDIQGLKKSYFNGVIGVGADYAISKHLSVTLFPTFNFATSSINKDAPVKAYPNTVSLATGLKFNL